MPSTRLGALFSSLAVFTVLATACAPAAPQTPATGGSSAPAQPAQEKEFTLRVGLTTLQATMDPHAALGSNVRRYGVYEALIDQDEQGKLQPGLATEWKNVNPSTWQFKLAQGRKFSDGNPVTAEDVKWSWDRAINPELKLATLTRLAPIDKIDIVDPQTVNIVTKGPDAILLKRVAAIPILQKAYVERIGPAEFATKGLGTGPYMQKEFKANDILHLVRNPHHPNKAAASEVIIRHLPEASSRVAGLKTGELDLIVGVPIDQPDSLKSAGFQIVPFDQGGTFGAFIFTNIPDSPTQNKLVRQAMNYAVDKEAIAKNVYKGYTKPTGQLVQASTVGYNPNIKPYPFDTKKAKELLAQAGYPNGIKIKMDVTLGIFEAQPLFLTVQSNFKEAGIDAEVNSSADSGFLLDRWYGRIARPHVFSAGLLNSPALDSSFALDWFRGILPEAERRFNSKDFDEPYLAAATELDDRKRTELLQKANQVMYDEAPFLFLVDGVNLWAAAKDLDNVKPRGDQEPRFDIIRKK